MSFVVLRKPVLMEDEGRIAFIGTAPTREAAEELVQRNLHNYFTAYDFSIIEERGK